MDEDKTVIDFGKSVADQIADVSFCEQNKNKSWPLAIIAFAEEVVKKVVNAKDKELFQDYFEGLTMTVPSSIGEHDNPHYHSVVSQKLLLVDWERAFGFVLTAIAKVLSKQREQISLKARLYLLCLE